MSVKKIFTILITIVACVAIGALVLNILMPNAVTQIVNTTEDMIHKATGIAFDFNGDSVAGGSGGGNTSLKENTGDKASEGAGVDGFQ